MNKRQQVLLIDQMNVLVELGIDTSKASMFYCGRDNNSLEVNDGCIEEGDILTFTLQDILEILPKSIRLEKNRWARLVFDMQGVFEYVLSEYGETVGALHCVEHETTLLGSAFEMLKWVKQNNYL